MPAKTRQEAAQEEIQRLQRVLAFWHGVRIGLEAMNTLIFERKMGARELSEWYNDTYTGSLAMTHLSEFGYAVDSPQNHALQKGIQLVQETIQDVCQHNPPRSQVDLKGAIGQKAITAAHTQATSI